MRIVFRRGNGEAIALSFPVIITLLLLLLASLGGVSVVVVRASQHSDERDVTARMGAKKNYAVLPEMSVALGGGGRTMDLRVRIELDPTVDPKVTAPYTARIADRLSDRMREVEPERLTGADGAQLMKNTITSVVDREIRTIKVRDVLLERMVIR
ncbi:flagellar basal body-associated FliL family protein [Azospirillum sp. sgz301742]